MADRPSAMLTGKITVVTGYFKRHPGGRRAVYPHSHHMRRCFGSMGGPGRASRHAPARSGPPHAVRIMPGAGRSMVTRADSRQATTDLDHGSYVGDGKTPLATAGGSGTRTGRAASDGRRGQEMNGDKRRAVRLPSGTGLLRSDPPTYAGDVPSCVPDPNAAERPPASASGCNADKPNSRAVAPRSPSALHPVGGYSAVKARRGRRRLPGLSILP